MQSFVNVRAGFTLRVVGVVSPLERNVSRLARNVTIQVTRRKFA